MIEKQDMKALLIPSFILIAGFAITSCKKGCTDPTAINYDEKAKKDNNECVYDEGYTIPTSYSFTDASGNSTVDFSGQTARLDQLSEMISLIETGTTTVLSAQDIKDMFANTGGNGNGLFSFTSTKQLEDKCFSLDVPQFKSWMDEVALASESNGSAASDGQAGVLSSGTSTYLFDANGRDYAEIIEKGLMGAVFLNQALNEYFGDVKMSVDNTTAVNASQGEYYTTMEHHFDEAFGYFGVDPNFPTVAATRFWGKYCNSQNATLNSNNDMMSNFLKGRAAISGKELGDRDQAIAAIRTEWEEISAYQAMTYIDAAISNFGTDNAKFLHALSEAYAFSWNLRYAPVETRRMNPSEHSALMAQFPTNFWSITIAELNDIKNTINAKY